MYTAKDLPEALSFLEQDPQIDVVVMEFAGAAQEAVAFCTQLKGDVRLAQVPVIGIVAADATQRQWDWSRTPPGVVEWMRSPVDSSEVLARVRFVLASHQPVTAPASAAGADRYQFAFEGSLDEIVVSDPKSALILDANATFEQRSGFSRAQVIPMMAVGDEKRDDVRRRSVWAAAAAM